VSKTSSDQWEQIRKISEAYCEAFFEAMEPARQGFSQRIAAFQETMQKEALSIGKAILSIAKKKQLAWIQLSSATVKGIFVEKNTSYGVWKPSVFLGR